MLAPGDIAQVRRTDDEKHGPAGAGAHATLASECRVAPQQRLLQRVGRGNGARAAHNC